MKKLLLPIFIILSLISIIGCGKKNTNKDGTPIVVDINKTSIKSNAPEEKIAYDKKKKVLTIGDSVTIKEGKPNNLPSDLPLIIGVKTYINSNVSNYFFYVIKGQNPDKPGQWFVDELKKKEYTLAIDENLPEEEQGINYSNMKFEKKDKDGNIIGTIQVSIYNKTPDNIKRGLGLDGLFIEIYYK